MNPLILDRMRSPELHIGAWMSIGAPVIAELASISGFDWILFDLEHGFISEDFLPANLQAVRKEEIAIMVRIGRFDPLLISRVLDWGASGIVMPHVSRVHEAKECLEAMYFPPAGKRGYSSSARSFNFGKERVKSPLLNSTLPLFWAQIETQEGVMNVDEIASLEGVDALFVGPSDLRLNLEVNSGGFDEKMYTDALDRVNTATRKHKKQSGILVKDLEGIPELKRQGFTIFSAASDLGILREGFGNIVNIW